MVNQSCLDVSIILCTCDRPEMLRQTIESLVDIDCSGLSVELLIVDNGQRSDVRDVAQNVSPAAPFEVVYLRQPNKGKARAYDEAFRHARGAIFVSTDDDVRFDAHWLTNLVAPLHEGKYAAVSGWIEMAAHLRRPWMTPGDHNFFACNHIDQQPNFPGLVGANMAMTREAILQVGGFNENLGPGALGFGEETLFQYQLSEIGLLAGPAYDAKVEHHFDPRRLEFPAMLVAAYNYGRFNGYMAYHWFGAHCLTPKLRFAWKRSKLRRRLAMKPSISTLGIDRVALRLSQGCGRMEQFRTESQEPRRYKHAVWSRWT